MHMTPDPRRSRPGRWAVLTFTILVVAACGQSPAPELILTHAAGVTLDASQPGFNTVAIGGGRILALADGIDPDWLATGPTVIDVEGAVVAPAFTDHHVHLFNVGMALLNARDGGRLAIDLSGVTSLAAIESLVRERAADLPAGDWILGGGWSQANWGTGALPTGDVLTRAAPSHPVFLARTDGHAGWVNAAALARGGVTRSTTSPAGGSIMHLPGGEPSGILLERANELLTPLLPAVADSDVVEAYRLAAQALAERGVAEAYDAGPLVHPGMVALNADVERQVKLLVRADSIEPLPLRINLMIPAPSAYADSLLAARPPVTQLSPRIRITHIKLFADGALGSRAAALSHPYADDPSTQGVVRMETSEIAEVARRALDQGLGVATHAIGDAAVGRVLDAYQQVLAERPDLDPRRLRIEHFSYFREGDIDRAVRLGVVLSIQSNFNAYLDEEVPLGLARVGAANEPRVYNWARLAAAGARLAEGSDYFAMPGPPLAGFAATLGRKYAVGQALPDAEARRLAYRANAVRFEPSGERTDGMLTVGAAADLVVWSADPFTIPRDALGEVTASTVVNAGRVAVPSAHR